MKLTLAVLLAWWTIYSKGMALSLPPSLIASTLSLQQHQQQQQQQRSQLDDDAAVYPTFAFKTLWPKDDNDNMIVNRFGYDEIARNNNNNNIRNIHKSYAMTHLNKRQPTTTVAIVGDDADADADDVRIVPTKMATTTTTRNTNANALQERIHDQLPSLLSAGTGARDNLNLDIGLVAPETAAAARLALPPPNAHGNQNHAILLPLLASASAQAPPLPSSPPPLQPQANSYFATPLNLWSRQCQRSSGASGKNCLGQNYANQLYADRQQQQQQQLATMLPEQLLATLGGGEGLLSSDFIVDGKNYEAVVAGLKPNPSTIGIFKDADFGDVGPIDVDDSIDDDDEDDVGIELNSLELPDKVNIANYPKLPTTTLQLNDKIINDDDDAEDDIDIDSDGDGDEDDNIDSDDGRYVSNDTFMLLTGERDLMKFLQWAMKQLYPYHKLTNFTDFDAADYNHPGMYIWRKFNLSGRLEPPLFVEEPHYVIVRREKLPEDFKAVSYKDDPFIPPRGRKHEVPDLDALLYRYDTFVPNRGRRDKIKDIFKYDDVFFPNRGKRQRQQQQQQMATAVVKKSPEFVEGYNTEMRDNNNEQSQQQQLIHGSWGNLKWKRKLQRIKNCLQYIAGTNQAHIYRINCNVERGNRFNGVSPQQQQQQMSKYKINRYDQSVKPAMSVVTRGMSATPPSSSSSAAASARQSPTAAAITTRIGEIAQQLQQQWPAFLQNSNNNNSNSNNNNYALRQRRIAGHFMNVGAAAAAANRNRNRLHATRSMSTASTTTTTNNAQRNRQRQQQQKHYTLPVHFGQQQ